MPIIIPSGLLRGERIGKLSDEARMYWPFLYAGSNGFARFEFNYIRILDRCFKQFSAKPTKELIVRVLREYREQHLLFIYSSGGATWGAWDSAAKQRYYSRDDLASPKPPEPQFSEWSRAYHEGKAFTDDGSLAAAFADGKVQSHGNSEISTETSGIYPGCSTTTTSYIINNNVKNNYNKEVSSTDKGNGENDAGGSGLGLEESSPSPPTAIEQCPPPAAPFLISGVEGWEELIEAATAARMVMDPGSDSDLCQKTWRWQSMAVKKAAIDGIRKRVANGQYSDPRYTPTLENYIRGKKWRESLRPESPKPKPAKYARFAALHSDEEESGTG